MICMIVRVELAAGMKGEYMKEYRKIASAVKQQEGCIEYNLFVDSEDPRFDNEKRADTLVFVEKWESIEALQGHSGSDVMQRFRERVKGLRAGSAYELLKPAVSDADILGKEDE